MKKGPKIIIVLVLIVLAIVLLSGPKANDDSASLPNTAEQTEQKEDEQIFGSDVNFKVDLKVVEALLGDSVWQWVETIYSNDTIVTPKDPTKFSIVFSEGGKFSAKTDCNDLFGEYTLGEGSISFSKIASTKMACSGETEEAKFTEMLTRARGFLFTADGALAITLEYDSGSVIFEPVR